MAKKTTEIKTSEAAPNEGATENQTSESANSPAAPEERAPDLTGPSVKAAIDAGQKVIAGGGTKADAARAMYDSIADKPKEVVVAAFVAGATLTEKGALTYWYNCKRKATRTK